MPIVRVRKEPGKYFQMLKATVEDHRLSWKAKGLMAYLISKPNDWQVWTKDLIKRSTDGRSAVLSALQELLKFGYAIRDQCRREDGTFGPVEFTVFEVPQLGFPLADKPGADNRTYTKNDYTNNDNNKNKEEISFDSLKAHPDSIKSKPALPLTKGYEPSVADPSENPPEIKELARQLAPPIDLVWDYDRATDKALLHAARELIKRCKGGDIDDILEALDAYLEKNGDWVRENIDSPMGLVTLVARQYQKLHGQAQRKAAASTEWAEAAARSQVALEGRLAEGTDSDRWWQDVLSELALQMTTDTFNARLKDTVLLDRQDARIVVAVANKHDLDWIENRLYGIIKRTLVGFGVDTVEFVLSPTQETLE